MNTLTTLRTLNDDIKTQEEALEVYMDMNLGNASIRKAMRKTLNTIETLEVSKSALLAAA